MANIIFDFDGTIADSFDYVFDFLCSEAGKSKEFIKTESDTYRRMPMKAVALKLGIPLWRLPYIYFKGRRVMRQHVLHIHPFAGMPEVISQLADGGHRLSIISANSSKNIRVFLKEHNLAADFSVVRGGTGILGKIAPIRKLKRRNAADVTWYIGDEVSDMVSAKAAGVQRIGVTWGFASHDELAHLSPEAIVDKPIEILDVISSKL